MKQIVSFRSIASTISVCLFAGALYGQSTFGSFVGTVRDPSHAVVPKCVITLTNTGTSAERTVETDKDGSYVLVNVEPGTYQIVMRAPGFQALVANGLELTARQTARVDGSLVVSAQAQSVQVNATAEATISTDVSNIAETKSGRELVDLPVAIASRALGSTSPISTLVTQAGVQDDGNGNLSVAGTKPSQLSVSIDGISTMSVRSESPIAELFPSFESIAEIRVSEINNTAEFGGVSDITTISKGGTNTLHGGVYENLQNTVMNARNPFSATVSAVKMNDFGAYVGGPVTIPHLYNGRDKTFYFVSYEGLRLPRQQFLSESVPSLALRSGDLSVYGLGQVPVSQISPVALAALKYLYPLPNTGPANAITNNYTTNFPTTISSNQGDARVDQNVNGRQSLFVRVSYKRKDVVAAPSGTIFAGGITQPVSDYNVTAAHNFLISPTVVNELRLGVSADRVLVSSQANANALIAEIGVPVPDPPGGTCTPTFSITGFQGTGSTCDSVSRTQTKQLLDNISWTRGSHTYKFGGDVRRLSAYFSNNSASSRMGSYGFNGSVSRLNPFQAFLMGIPDQTGVTEVTTPDTNASATHYAVYAQDDWKVTPHLTLNYGVRWEYHPSFSDTFSNQAVLLPDAYNIVNGVTVHGSVVVPDAFLPHVNAVFAESIAPTPIIGASQAGIPQTLHIADKTSFAPRIGVAWRPFGNDKTVIRAGFGRFIETVLGTLASAGWGVPAGYTGAFTNTLVNGKPTLSMPYPFPSNLAQPGVQEFISTTPVNYKDPYVYQWNFTFERDLGNSIGLRLSYDGNHGGNIGYTDNLDQVAPNTIGFAKAVAGAPYPLWAAILDHRSGARSNYDEGAVEVNKRLSHGLQFSSSYAFAKNLSNGQGFNPSGYTSQGGGTVSDIYNINLDYGLVPYTRRNRWLSTFLYELPFGRKGSLFTGTNRWVDSIVGGWQLSGVLLFQSGPFLTVVAPGVDPAGNNSVNISGSGRADIVPGVPLYPANQSIADWVNPAAFVKPANNIGRIGNSPIGAVVGPGTQAVSLSLFKAVAIGERVRFQIGAAASNALNHPNYAPPSNLSIGTAGFSSITNVQSQDAGGPRAIQVTARLRF
ncbi:MAG: TonB-dependent receptor [Acidobacteriia bacterium]|nr:TonB-dependent receptor [Terriglobia bacterium]